MHYISFNEVRTNRETVKRLLAHGKRADVSAAQRHHVVRRVRDAFDQRRQPLERRKHADRKCAHPDDDMAKAPVG